MKIIRTSRNGKAQITQSLGTYYVRQIRVGLPTRTASYKLLKDANREYNRIRR